MTIKLKFIALNSITSINFLEYEDTYNWYIEIKDPYDNTTERNYIHTYYKMIFNLNKIK